MPVIPVKKLATDLYTVKRVVVSKNGAIKEDTGGINNVPENDYPRLALPAGNWSKKFTK
jgi:hypothetical protein